MSVIASDRSVRLLAKAIGYGCFLVGMLYAGYLNGLLKGEIASFHRGALLIGFVVGVGFISAYVMRSLATHLSDRLRKRR
jgi:hypothetical protein